MSGRTEKQRRLDELRAEVAELESALSAPVAADEPQWQATGYYTAYYATTGFILGGIAAMSSLLANVVGALLFGKPLLELIRVYLTFPMGEKALELSDSDGGLTLAIGCCLYIVTGMLYGILFQIVLSRFAANSTFATQFVVVSLLALGVWLVNFYLLLSWLQPLLFGGNWIVEEIPPWVAALTHLVFGWTMAVVYPLGVYRPYRVEVR